MPGQHLDAPFSASATPVMTWLQLHDRPWAVSTQKPFAEFLTHRNSGRFLSVQSWWPDTEQKWIYQAGNTSQYSSLTNERICLLSLSPRFYAYICSEVKLSMQESKSWFCWKCTTGQPCSEVTTQFFTTSLKKGKCCKTTPRSDTGIWMVWYRLFLLWQMQSLNTNVFMSPLLIFICERSLLVMLTVL